MAAGLGFKDFVTGEVLTAADVDGYLMQGIWVFADATARNAAVTSPQEGNACYLKDTDVIQVYNGSTWVTQSSNNSGKVLQSVQATTNTDTSNSTSTYADSTLTVNITPTLATSKILIMTSQALRRTDGSTGNAVQTRLMRDSTVLLTTAPLFYTGTAVFQGSQQSLVYLDTPATTSALTYKTQFRNIQNTATTQANYDSNTASIVVLEIGV
jgi:hypothetical protein